MSSLTQHTPGPWIAEGNHILTEDKATPIAFAHNDVNAVAMNYPNYKSYPTPLISRANAALIAAAPETAKELERVKAELNSANKSRAEWVRIAEKCQAETKKAAAQRDELLAMLKRLRAGFSSCEKDNMEFSSKTTCYVMDEVDAAIARAEGGQS
jgi:hypothetical protein